jgi:hypothetical protein
MMQMSKLCLYCHSLVYRLDFLEDIDQRISRAITEGLSKFMEKFEDEADKIAQSLLTDEMMRFIRTELSQVGSGAEGFVDQIDRIFEESIIPAKEKLFEESDHKAVYAEKIARFYFEEILESGVDLCLEKEDSDVMKRYLDADYFDNIRNISGSSRSSIGDYEPCSSSTSSSDVNDGILSAISLPMERGNFYIYETPVAIQFASYSDDRLVYSLRQQRDQHFEIRFDEGHRYDDVMQHDFDLDMGEYLIVVRGVRCSQAWVASADCCRKVWSVEGCIVDGYLTSKGRLWLLVSQLDEELLTKVVCVSLTDRHAVAEEQMTCSRFQ